MVFDKNQTEFTDDKQKRIWVMGKNIVPLDISLKDIEDVDEREMFRQMHDFTIEFLSDMYENPLSYSQDVFDAPEAFICVMSDLARGELDGNDLILPFDKINYSGGRFDRIIDVKPYLERFGVFITVDDNEIKVVSKTYPKLLTAYTIMRKSADRFKVGSISYINVCDFRILDKKFAHSFEDYARVISDQDRIIMEDFHNYALSLKIKPIKCIYFQRIFYKYRGKRILDIDFVNKDTDPKPFMVVRWFWQGSITWEENKKLLTMLEEKIDQLENSEKYRKYFTKYIKYCSICHTELGTCREGEFIEIWGRKRFLCRAGMFYTKKIDEEAIEFFKLILKLRTEVIDKELEK